MIAGLLCVSAAARSRRGAGGCRGGRTARLREAAGAGEGFAFTPLDFCRGKRLWSCPGASLCCSKAFSFSCYLFFFYFPPPLFFFKFFSFSPVLSSSTATRLSWPPRSAPGAGAAGGESGPAPPPWPPRPRALRKKKRVLTLT